MICFGLRFGRFWAAFGERSWGPIRSKIRPQIARPLSGDLWAVLGRSWGGLGAQADVWSMLTVIWVPTWLPKGAPKATKTEPKTIQNKPKSKTNFDIEKEALQDRLGAILGRSWPHLGVDFGEKTLENVDPRENLHF